MKLTNTWIEKSSADTPRYANVIPLSNASAQVIDRYRRLLEERAEPNEWAFAWRTELNRGGFPAHELLTE